MDAAEFDVALKSLSLQANEASRLLGVSSRTLRRWSEGEAVPATAVAALNAWLKLQDWGIPWRPDTVSVVADDRDQIRRMREHAVDVQGMIARVQQRGGSRNRWSVDFGRGEAMFGPMRVAFYHLANGGFSLSSYSRRDERPDVRRDAEHLEDAAFCIAEDYRRHGEQAAALRRIVDYLRRHSATYVRDGAGMPSASGHAARVSQIEAVASKMDDLATAAAEHRGSYQEFLRSLDNLHELGFFPRLEDVSAVARAFG